MKAALLLIFAFVMLACVPAKSAETERFTVRGAIHGMAWGVQLAAAACSDAVEQMPEGAAADKLLETCDVSFIAAKEALLAAEFAADKWDAKSPGKIACMAGRAMIAYERILTALDRVGMRLPNDIKAPVEDAIQLGKFLIALSGGTNECAYTPAVSVQS